MKNKISDIVKDLDFINILNNTKDAENYFNANINKVENKVRFKLSCLNKIIIIMTDKKGILQRPAYRNKIYIKENK